MYNSKMNTIGIISRYYSPGSLAYKTLIAHSKMVVGKCLAIAAEIRYKDPDISFLREAAMLHDIGIFLAKAPHIGCYGNRDYICHGYLGRDLLEKEGLPIHALVCERHVGVGLSISDIMGWDLPLPAREMLPVTLEEKIICYADKFYSKKTGALCSEKTLEEVREDIRKYGDDKLQRFDEMTLLFQ